MARLKGQRDVLMKSGIALLLLDLSRRGADKTLRTLCIESVSNFHNDDKDIYLDKNKCLERLRSANYYSKDFSMKSRVSCLLHVLVLDGFKSLDMDSVRGVRAWCSLLITRTTSIIQNNHSCHLHNSERSRISLTHNKST